MSTLRTGLTALVLACGMHAAPTPNVSVEENPDFSLEPIPPAINMTAVTYPADYKDFAVFDTCDCNKYYGNEYRSKLDCDVSCDIQTLFSHRLRPN